MAVEKITPAKAAEIMGKSVQYVRWGLIDGMLPFGTAYKIKGSRVYTYYINPKDFWGYIGEEYKENKESEEIQSV